jgi:hypothetical protein
MINHMSVDIFWDARCRFCDYRLLRIATMCSHWVFISLKYSLCNSSDLVYIGYPKRLAFNVSVYSYPCQLTCGIIIKLLLFKYQRQGGCQLQSWEASGSNLCPKTDYLLRMSYLSTATSVIFRDRAFKSSTNTSIKGKWGEWKWNSNHSSRRGQTAVRGQI